MKIFLDTNVFLRFLVVDEKNQHKECLALFEKIQEGKHIPYTSGLVFMELSYVLIKIYRQKKTNVVAAIEKLLLLRNLTIVEKVDTRGAIKTYKNLNIKFGDCLIATQITKGVRLVSYDREFQKIKGLDLVTPHEIT